MRVLETQKAVAETAVGVLEGVKFGSVKRGIGAEVGYLGAVAEGMEEKLRLACSLVKHILYVQSIVFFLKKKKKLMHRLS